MKPQNIRNFALEWMLKRVDVKTDL